MIIAINTRLLIKNRIEGIGRFTLEILKRITNEHKEHIFIFFFDRKYEECFLFSENIIPVVLFPPSRHPFLWYWFFEYSITKALKKYKADIFITTDGWLSTRTNVKTLQVLHDLHYENYPEFLPYLTRKYYQYFFPKFVKKATRIISVSHFCKNEIIKKYSLVDNNVDVVYNSSREEYKPLFSDDIIKVKNKYSGGKSYFLFIGPIHPRKNLVNAINAFFDYKLKTKDDTKLVVTGTHMWKKYGRIEKIPRCDFTKDIIYTGYLNKTELQQITGAADCLLYVSFYEGFGMPILEAMSCNVPVITSITSAMPEVAGDAAILIDPKDYHSITKAMLKIKTDLEFKRELIIKGQKNLERFSWDNSSKIFWNCIMKTIDDAPENITY